MSALDRLREEVCEANRALASSGLAPLTWGNASGISSDRSMVAIKPSGVPYAALRPSDIVVVDLAGRHIAGALRPSTDMPTHLCLYRAWPQVGGIVHTHSRHATAFAQARRAIPCLGTTHADHFGAAVPVTRQLADAELADYEAATGRVIVERFTEREGPTPDLVPAILVAGHAPFTWGRDVRVALDNAIALEAIAAMALDTLALGSPVELEARILGKHRERKHGEGAYYGQQPGSPSE